MKQTNARGKYKYLKDYEKNDSGDYIYISQYYYINGTSKELRADKIAYIILTAATLVLYIAAGFLNNAGSRVVYVVLPYVLMFLPIFLSISDIYKIITGGVKMTRKQFDHSYVQLKNVTVAVIILSAMGVIGDILLITMQYSINEVFYLASFIFICAINIIYIYIQKRKLKNVTH